MANKIINGSPPTRQALGWQIDYHVQHLARILTPQEGIIFSHVKHKANVLADFLATKGIKAHQLLTCWSPVIENLLD